MVHLPSSNSILKGMPCSWKRLVLDSTCIHFPWRHVVYKSANLRIVNSEAESVRCLLLHISVLSDIIIGVAIRAKTAARSFGHNICHW